MNSWVLFLLDGISEGVFFPCYFFSSCLPLKRNYRVGKCLLGDVCVVWWPMSIVFLYPFFFFLFISHLFVVCIYLYITVICICRAGRTSFYPETEDAFIRFCACFFWTRLAAFWRWSPSLSSPSQTVLPASQRPRERQGSDSPQSDLPTGLGVGRCSGSLPGSRPAWTLCSFWRLRGRGSLVWRTRLLFPSPWWPSLRRKPP